MKLVTRQWSADRVMLVPNLISIVIWAAINLTTPICFYLFSSYKKHVSLSEPDTLFCFKSLTAMLTCSVIYLINFVIFTYFNIKRKWSHTSTIQFILIADFQIIIALSCSSFLFYLVIYSCVFCKNILYCLVVYTTNILMPIWVGV